MDPEELELMGIRDYFGDDSIRLVEWPKQGEGVLPQSDIIVNIIYSNETRIAKIISNSELGKNIVNDITLIYNG
jgi:tRNA threonylcarbamoyladenosine biosynthesis protein TsaE